MVIDPGFRFIEEKKYQDMAELAKKINYALACTIVFSLRNIRISKANNGCKWASWG